MKRLLSGKEAVAYGAWGTSVSAGTPGAEILEAFARFPHVYAEMSPNEKVALDVAIVAAYAGIRAMAVMKYVDVKVAADALIYVVMTGLEADRSAPPDRLRRFPPS